MPIKRDFYDVLGVDKAAGAAELKAAYRKQALAWHPDRNKSPEAEEKFKEVNEAYEVLSNPDKKAAYDNYGHEAFTQGGMGGAGGFGGQQTYQSGPFTYSYTTGDEGFSAQGGPASGWDFSDPFEIFEQFFGGANPFGGRQRQIPHYSITLDFLDAAKGCTKDVSIEGERRSIKIPAGVDDGSRIKFDDFYLSIDVKPDRTFKREGADVVVNVDLPFTLAILGGEISVPTIDGALKLKIRAGTQPGTVVRLSGRGIKRLHHNSRGDEYVRLIVKLPEKLSREQKELLQKFEGKKEEKNWF